MMPLYYPGYSKALDQVNSMTLDELLRLLDDLYGRDNLKYGDTVEDVRAEARRQVQRDWTDTSSEEYKRRQEWLKD